MHFVQDGSIKMTALLLSPVRRLMETPESGAVTAVILALWQKMTGTPFGYALTLVIITTAIDYVAGSITAHSLKEYKSGLAYNGALSKILGLVLVLLVRALEGFVAKTSFFDTNGALATAAAVSLIAVDLVSISKHRQRLGGTPIPFVSALADWIQEAVLNKLPGRKTTKEQ